MLVAKIIYLHNLIAEGQSIIFHNSILKLILLRLGIKISWWLQFWVYLIYLREVRQLNHLLLILWVDTDWIDFGVQAEVVAEILMLHSYFHNIF